jgi:UPF0755 protein
MWRSVASNALTFLIVLFLGVGIAGLWAKNEYMQAGPLDQGICLRVAPGSKFYDTADDLKKQGAISSASLFRIGAEYNGKANQLKAGSFLIPAAASMDQVVDLITKGGANTCGTEIVYRIGVASTTVQVRELDPATERFVERAAFKMGDDAPSDYIRVLDAMATRHRIAMAEGVTSWQVVQAINGIEVLQGDITEIPAEGTLAPFSYEVASGDTRASVIADMVARQTSILDQAWTNRAADLPLKSKEEALILASIIEKETSVPDERGLVSSVFINRLKQGMPLQTDPTVIYGITKGQGVLGRGLRRSELRGQTPWNTYVIRGLPPTPIANPGADAIAAAVNPDDSRYIFFVADGTGGHAFAETLAEHNANVAKWRQIEAERATD